MEIVFMGISFVCNWILLFKFFTRVCQKSFLSAVEKARPFQRSQSLVPCKSS